MTAYTNVPKPTGVPYTTVNPQGRQTYNEPLLTYDDSGTFYDGVDTSAYTSVSKPIGTPYTNVNKPTT